MTERGPRGTDEERLDAYEHAPCGLLLLGSDGRITRVNQTLCVWMGGGAEKFLQRSFPELMSMGSKLFHQTHWAPLLQLQGSVSEVQLELITLTGQKLPVLVNAIVRADKRTDIALFVAADRRKYERELLLARRRAEELLEREQDAQTALRQAQSRLQLALDSAHLFVWTVELPSGVPQYGREVASLLGTEALESVSTEVYSARIHPDDRARASAAIVDALEGRAAAVEYRLRGLDGVERIVRATGRAFFDADGHPIDFSGVLEDVTDRRLAEDVIRARELQFRTLAENSPDVIARFDTHGRCSYMSPAIESLSSLPAVACVDRTIEELGLTAEATQAMRAAFDMAMAGHEHAQSFRHETDTDRVRELEARAVPERNHRGDVVSVLAFTRDVTALKEQEREARQRAELAEQLIGIVSHDLRNPLNAILLAAQILGSADLGAHARLVQRITSAGQRATRMISDLLDFTQAQLGGGLRVHPTRLDLHATVADSVEELRLAWPARAIEHVRRGDSGGFADGDRLAQVITNLVTNAITYGTPDEPIRITSWVTTERQEIQVHNTGRPIPEELLAHIFQPLRRGDEQVQRGSRSVGLGLYIVQQIATAHGGRVTVRSTAAEGTTFCVTLPREPSPIA